MATVLILAQVPSCLSYQIRVLHLHIVHSFNLTETANSHSQLMHGAVCDTLAAQPLISH